MVEKSNRKKFPEPPTNWKPYFYEDFGCAITYFKENLEKIQNILKLKESIQDIYLRQLLLEFSTVLLVSAFEGYCHEKIRELTAGRENREEILKQYNFQDPTNCNKAFREIAGIEVLKVFNKGKPQDQDKLRRMKILFEKRHCIVHRNSKVSSELRDLLNQKVAIDARIPLTDMEINNVMGIMREFVIKVESNCPSPVDWGKEGFKL